MEYSGRQWARNPVIAIIAAAVLFGIATPVLKLLLSKVTPVLLVTLLSLGAGGGVLCWLAVCQSDFSVLPCRALPDRDRYWLAGTVVIGGVVAPLVQFISLAVTPAATASLLLNFEIVSTLLIAYLIFREPVDRKTGLALTAILTGSILLSWNGGSVFDFSIGAAGIVVSCFLWGLDNNFMGRISGLSPGMIVVVKELVGGGIVGTLVILFREPFPGWVPVGFALLTGFLSFGVGLVLLITALRTMGAARAGAVYAAAPFIGCVVSLFLFSDRLGNQFWVSFCLFLAGSLVIIREQWEGRNSTSRKTGTACPPRQ
jgi:drug/metabolite transporter (DMT)-like permease